MLALQTGEIKPDGIDLNFLVIDDPREIFDRMSNRLEFDACEMSSSEYVSRLAAKKLPFVGLPVFASRVFRHGFIVVNRRFVTSAKDLAGKRVGVPLYTQTAAIFIRGPMQHDLGIDLSKRDSRDYRLPSAAGAQSRHPDVVRLLPDYRAREQDYFRRTRIFPIMHLIVVRKDIYERHPFVVTSLYEAFCAAKDRAREKSGFPARSATCCRGYRRTSKRSTHCSAATAAPMASSRTGRRSKPW
jgi:4,5-dihydroxyphthalate decarboxylase